MSPAISPHMPTQRLWACPASTTIRSYGATDVVPPADPVRVAGEPQSKAPTTATDVRDLTAAELEPTADASYSGAPDTVPAAMLDGDTASGGWSNYYDKDATALLPSFSSAHPSDWISVSWPGAQTFGTVKAYFTIGSGRARPAAIDVTYRKGDRYAPVRNLKIDWGAGSNQPTTITFDPLRTTSVKLDMTSPAPGTATGFLQIAEVQVAGG